MVSLGCSDFSEGAYGSSDSLGVARFIRVASRDCRVHSSPPLISRTTWGRLVIALFIRGAPKGHRVLSESPGSFGGRLAVVFFSGSFGSSGVSQFIWRAPRGCWVHSGSLGSFGGA